MKPIRVNVIAPGLFGPALFDVFGRKARAAIFQRAARTQPVGRARTAGEVMIVFPLRNGYMNGEMLHIDGGGRMV